MLTETKVLKFLIDTKKEPTIRGLAREIKSDYKIVHTAVKRLVCKRVLEEKIIGQSIQVKFSGNLSKEVLEAEVERRDEILKNKNLKLMLEIIKKDIKTVNFILLLFGSYSKNKADRKSDIDLMFIISDKRVEKGIEQSISTLPLKIHYFVFTEKEFKTMKNAREPNLVHEAVEHNIILNGIEQYYELLIK